ncbi:MAG: tetratricopeptide repeat protein, partial [Dehalococcoidia bacterium]
ALVYYQQGEFDLALEEARAALRSAEAGNYPRIVATALMNQGIIQQALGAHSDSLSSASRALHLSRQLLDQRLIAESTNVMGNAYRRMGDTSKAEVLLSQAALEVESSGQKYISATYRLSLGKVYYQQGSHQQALEHLKQAEAQLVELNSPRRIAESKLYQAAEHYRSGDMKKTITCLEQVSASVTDLGYDGFLLADGKELLDVLRFGAVKRLGGDSFVQLVNRLSPPPTLDESSYQTPCPGGLASFPPIQAFGFGNPRVALDTHEITDAEWRSRKAKELFFYLLYNRRIISNDEILEALWPDDSVDLSASALKTNIYRLRQALFFDCIVAKESGYCINPEISITFDLAEFKQNLRLASEHRDDQGARELYLVRAAEIYEGPFLDGVYSGWCEELRSDMELKYHTALMTLASYYADKAQYVEAADLLEKIVSADPFNEEAQYRLIECYIQNEDPFAAMQRLRKYARLSMEELGTNLSGRFANCHRKIVEMVPAAV